MKILAPTLIALISLIILGVIGYFYGVLFPPKIITFPDREVTLSQNVYRPGDTVNFNLRYCKYQNIEGEHTITLVDSVILPVYSDIRFLPLGCHTALYPIVLVAVTPPGNYHLTLKINYRIPFLFFAGTEESYTISSSNFTVVAP